jgi:hypothetical protein
MMSNDYLGCYFAAVLRHDIQKIGFYAYEKKPVLFDSIGLYTILGLQKRSTSVCQCRCAFRMEIVRQVSAERIWDVLTNEIPPERKSVTMFWSMLVSVIKT